MNLQKNEMLVKQINDLKSDDQLAQFHSLLGQKQGYIDQLSSQVRDLQNNNNIDRDKEYWESRLKVVEYKSKCEECQGSKDMLQSMVDKLMISKGKTHSSSEETSEVESESTKSEEIGYAGKKRTKSHKY